MNKQWKKMLALLTAGMVFAASSAAYAAQVPNDLSAQAVASSSSSQQQLYASIDLQSFKLVNGNLNATFQVGFGGAANFRRDIASYVVEKENGAGTNDFVKVLEGETDPGISQRPLQITASTSLQQGERIRVRISASAYGYHGYAYAGIAYETKEFYFYNNTGSI